MTNWIKEAWSKAQDIVPGVREAKDLQSELWDYYDERLEEGVEMSGAVGDEGKPIHSWKDMGGRPAPLNPLMYPTEEELDAIRHYYGPQMTSEASGGGPLGAVTSFIAPLGHEIEGVAAGDGIQQIGPDLYNNMVAWYDEVAGKDIMPATGLLNRLKRGMPPGEFARFSEHALSRTMVPPQNYE